jgi:hypothetical protein
MRDDGGDLAGGNVGIAVGDDHGASQKDMANSSLAASFETPAYGGPSG